MSTESPVLVFDGVCVLCNRSVQFVLRHDRKKIYRFATAQSAQGQQLLRERGIDPGAPSSVLLIVGEASYIESEAVLRVLASFGTGWRVLATVCRIVPRVARDPVYRWIARHRYRWFGRRDICYLPTADEAVRFIG